MKKFRWILCGVSLALMISVLAAFGGKTSAPEAIPMDQMRRMASPPIPPQEPRPGNCRVTGDVFRRGETLSKLLERYDMDPRDIHNLSHALADIVSPRKIRAGSSVTLYRDTTDHRIDRLEITIAPDRQVSIIRDQDRWIAREINLELFNRTNQGRGAVTESLWVNARQVDIPPEIILDMADVFGWQVDFTSGLREGDQFNVIYTSRIVRDGGELAGDILAAHFINEAHEFYAFRYELPDGRVDYFDSQGQSMRREFLKSPLRYRYISSGYTNRRFHPILKIYRPHLGIDYAAPRGTPVSALGDGVVVYCGRKGGYGKYIQIKHGDAYETCYGHLSGYAKGVKRGAHVSQGQVIGYVGSTGLSTGPHLDFRVKYRGNFINPNSIKSEPAEPIPDSVLADYQAERDAWIQKLNS